MSSKKNKGGLVYSTAADWQPQEPSENQNETLPNKQQKLRIRIETKQRGGKAVVVVGGFVGTEEDLQELAKRLKAKCGTGGSAKDGEIIIQGNDKEKVLNFLKTEGYSQSR